MARKLLIPALILGVLLALPANAAAASPDVCVWDQDVSPPPAACGIVYNLNRAGLGTALTVADGGMLAFQGETTLRIGPGILSLDTPVTIAPSTGEPLHIVGAGSGAGGTVLTQAPTVPIAIDFSPTYVTDSSISDLAINVASATNPFIGMRAQGGRLDNLHFRVPGDTESYHAGLLLEGDSPTVVSGTSFTVAGPGVETLGVRVRNNSAITRSVFSVEGVFHPGQVGAIVEGTSGDGLPGAKITRSSFSGFDLAVSHQDGLLYLQDDLIDLASEYDAIGVSIRDQLSGSAPLDFRGDGLTIVGGGTVARGVDIDTTAGDDNASISISDMIGLQTGSASSEVSCVDDAGSAATLTLIFNLFALADYLPSSAAGGCAINQHSNLDRVVTPAQFVGAAAGDYRPTADSPVVDAGNFDVDRYLPKLDLAGLSRFVDGNGDGRAQIDIGAYEFQPQPPASTSVIDDPSLRWGKPVGRFVILKKPKAFSLTTARKKPRYPLNLDRQGPVTLTLARSKAGWYSGGCKKSKPKKRPFKRCDLPMKGAQRFTLPAGDSFFTFGGRWNKKKLKPGKYKLSADNQGFKPAVTILTLKKRR